MAPSGEIPGARGEEHTGEPDSLDILGAPVVQEQVAEAVGAPATVNDAPDEKPKTDTPETIAGYYALVSIPTEAERARRTIRRYDQRINEGGERWQYKTPHGPAGAAAAMRFSGASW